MTTVTQRPPEAHPLTTAGQPAKPAPSAAPARLGLALLVISAAQLMIVLDATIVNVALPAIQSSLGFSNANLVWVTTAYALAFGGLLLFGGRLGDMFGRRRMFMVGIALFSVASLLGGFATEQAWLIAARALQGAGGAIAAPAALALIATNFGEGRARNRAMGIYAAMAGAGAAIGLILGGVLTDLASWEWVLFVNVPIGVVVLLLTPLALRESEAHPGKLDIPGTFTVTAGMALLVYGFTNASVQSWSATATVASLAAAAVLLVTFVIIEVFSRHALMPMRIFADRSRSAAYLIMLCVGVAMFATFYFLTQYLQFVKGYSPLDTGLGFLPFVAAIGISTQIASVLMGRVGARLLSVVGLTGVTGGLYLLSLITVDTQYWDFVARLCLMGLGMGFTFVSLTLVAIAGVQSRDTGLASALLNTGQQIGGAVGLAVLSTIAVTTIENRLADGDLPPTQRALELASVDGYTQAFVIAAAISAFALLIAAVAVRTPRTPIEPAQLAQLTQAVGADVDTMPPLDSSGKHGVTTSSLAVAEASTTIMGSVRRADGVAIAGASLTLIDTCGEERDRTTTDSQGRYNCQARVAGEYLLVCSHPPYNPEVLRVGVTSGATRGDITLTGAVGLRGRVLAAGLLTPISDALVVLTDAQGLTVARTRSDSSGSYQVGELVEGAYTLTTCAGAHPPSAISVVLPATGTLSADVIVPLPPPLAGTVRSAVTGLPLAEAQVTVLDAAGHVVARTSTSHDGTFGVGDLIVGDYTVVASGYAAADTVAALRTDASQPVELALGPAAR